MSTYHTHDMGTEQTYKRHSEKALDDQKGVQYGKQSHLFLGGYYKQMLSSFGQTTGHIPLEML